MASIRSLGTVIFAVFYSQIVPGVSNAFVFIFGYPTVREGSIIDQNPKP